MTGLDGLRVAMSHDEGVISTLHGMSTELLFQTLSSRRRLRNDQQPRGVLVNAMDDSGSKMSIRVSGIPSRHEEARAGEKPIDQSTLRMTLCWMNDQSGRLVHDQELVVLVDDVDLNGGVWLSIRKGRSCGASHNQVPWSQPVFRTSGAASDAHPVLSDPALHFRSG